VQDVDDTGAGAGGEASLEATGTAGYTGAGAVEWATCSSVQEVDEAGAGAVG